MSATAGFAEKDLQYLDQELEKLRGNIRKDKDMLRQHLQLSSDMTGFRLTLLAGIFLPLSFTTSIFGMNIQNTPQEGLQLLSNFTNQTLAGLSVNARNSTQALVTSVANSGPLTYDWTTFAITSICVLATLPFTLTIGFILRNLVVLSAKYIVYWRAALVVIGMPFAFMSMFGSFIGRQLFLIARDSQNKRYSQHGEWVPINLQTPAGTYNSAAYTFVMVYSVLNAIVLVSVFTRACRAWSARSQRVVWITATFTAVVCFVVESVPPLLYGEMERINFPLMVIPWAIIALGYLIPWIEGRWSESPDTANLKVQHLGA
ncbi:hypothetical protein PG995_006627 [Apiospora arundinis]